MISLFLMTLGHVGCINFRYFCLLSSYLGVNVLVSDSPQSPSSFLGCYHWDAVGWEARQPSLRIIWRKRERELALDCKTCLGRLHLLSFTGGSDLHPSLMTLPALASFLLFFFFPHRHFLWENPCTRNLSWHLLLKGPRVTALPKVCSKLCSTHGIQEPLFPCTFANTLAPPSNWTTSEQVDTPSTPSTALRGMLLARAWLRLLKWLVTKLNPNCLKHKRTFIYSYAWKARVFCLQARLDPGV